MSASASFSTLLQRFFMQRLMAQRQVSPHTIASYRDTFRLLLRFVRQRSGKAPSKLELADIDANLISAFLTWLQEDRGASSRTSNQRLTAIRSFLAFAAMEEPACSGSIARALAIPFKRQARPMVEFLSRQEVEALLAVPDRSTWIGRRDYALLFMAAQTGLRVSELTGLRRDALAFGSSSAHVHCHGKGRKDRCTPLTRSTVAILKGWIAEPAPHGSLFLFPSRAGDRLSSDSVQYMLTKYAAVASRTCSSLHCRRISPHVLRHSAAMELLLAGVDTSVIALWLGHESSETTQAYLHAHIALKEAALAKTSPIAGKPGSFKADDQLLAFLEAL